MCSRTSVREDVNKTFRWCEMTSVKKQIKELTILFLIFILFIGSSASYKPVVMIHGLLDDSQSLNQLATYVKKVHPGTPVVLIDNFAGWMSLLPLWVQVRHIGDKISSLMKNASTGWHLIGYSQGGLIARGLAMTMKSHNIHTFISLSSPQMGQYGDTSIGHHIFNKLVKEYAYKVFYTLEGQMVSVGNYWHDPHHEDIFYNMSAYLPLINNQVEHNSSSEFKKNFQRLKRLILIGGPDDGVLAPWQTSQFGFYNDKEEVVAMKNQWVYKTNSFGLKTLMKHGLVHIFSIAGIDHFQWHKNYTVFDKYILPYLD